MEKLDCSEKELLEALERSGYLLESEISDILNKSGFITENNQVIIDAFTGKSREIDLTAEFFNFRHRTSKTKCVSKVRFVFEIKNNIAPIVLLTKFEHSPNLEDWLGLKRWGTIPTGLKNIYYTGYWDKLVQDKRGSIFTQYCSFQRKKANEDLMALHPDNIYSGLSKITQFCEEAIDREETEEPENGYWRDFIYIPVLLIADDLYELHTTGDNRHNLKNVDLSMLVYNYHYKKTASMAYVFVVTKKGFPDFIETMLKIEEEIETEMTDLRLKNVT
ncbi:MAG TPA: hypothetical protein VNI52_09750 [Sphingobacteriaceae bacterium]|nr:hypothetical protein [Sphingobacteriaceae bacterium]